MSPSEKWVFLGKILREWGIRGQVRLIPYNSESNFIARLKEVYLGDGPEFRCLKVLEIRRHGQTWLLHLEGYSNPETAKQLRQMQLAVPRSRIPKPRKGEIYVCDLEGGRVQNFCGVELGTIKRFQKVGDSEVMVIDLGAGKEAMVPYRAEFVASTSLQDGLVVLKETAEELL